LICRENGYAGANKEEYTEKQERVMGIALATGLATYPFATVGGFWAWVEQCEDSPIDSIWQTDTLVSKEPMLECMSTMAALAGRTKRLKFGMNVASVGLRDPLLLAKQCATIDFLSDGRLLPAFGIGSVRSADWRASGRPTERRGKRTDEGLEIITRLWRGETVDFDGEFYKYEGVQINPQPKQGKIPLWIGGGSKAAIRRTARFGTGWQAAFETPEQAGQVVADIKAALNEAGRVFDHEHFGTGINFRFGGFDDRAVAKTAERYDRVSGGRSAIEAFAVGGADEIIDRVRDFVEHDISKFVMRPLSIGDADTVEQTRLLIEEVMPAVDEMNAARKAAKLAATG
jgi:probable F420-dependent oxidoreductase